MKTKTKEEEEINLKGVRKKIKEFNESLTKNDTKIIKITIFLIMVTLIFLTTIYAIDYLEDMDKYKCERICVVDLRGEFIPNYDTNKISCIAGDGRIFVGRDYCEK